MNRQPDLNLYPFYGHLTANERRLYLHLLPQIQAASASIRPTVRATGEEFQHAFEAIHRDRPELFWLSGNIDYTTIDGIVSEIQPDYYYSSGSLARRQRELEKRIENYLRPVRGLTPPEQERAIHDRMVESISYIHGAGDQTAYAALVEGKAVCAGYSRGFQLLMQRLGIPCYYCGGEAIGRGDRTWSPHAWNILKLGGDFYNVDITWNDCYDTSSENISYTYFNCTDDQIRSNHRRDPEFRFLPACSGTRFSFQNLYGIPPELEVIYQDGVTCRTPVTDRKTFLDTAKAELKRAKGRTLVVSFPVKGAKLIENASEIFGDAVSAVFPLSGWHLTGRTTDYRNGWYRLEFTLKLK